jgi:NAD(P)-dependent dehydrogenase (short-subunit alcohol dehydrogenase family)
MFCDVTKESDISDAIKQAKETYGKQYLDIFYNNAWINKDVTPIVNSAVYKETMEVNLHWAPSWRASSAPAPR